ncbi:hypothetical protein CEP54_000060 [Fusarium duplospermum]|uniref:Cation/H+ exchanger transmembrane domain-containing protein n=1 Tax=Fusarium duplospermum TaxID=1325734 RepID=A0A428R8B7_9HYPO|nr:hypothetical protein CEP54_000060 [Fusarium duplospermum]
MQSSLAYHEPSITVISILSGFLLLLNLLNYGLDRIAYCGLIGQVALGIAWGTPGAKWLSSEVEDAVMQLGYLGLILIVYEGGLATSFRSLKANIGLSSGVAVTGILLPIGLSFALKSMFNASPLQAFAAGAALCSTSLGTTFTILGTSGLSTTRLGVVLTSAAMMDDVVGLIMVQVISNLGGDSFDAVTVVRPVMVSLAFATLMPVLGRFVVMPVTAKLNVFREGHPSGKMAQLLRLRQTAFVIHTALLLGLVVGATFAGTSSLLAAYITGATISWWDSEVAHVPDRVANISPGVDTTEERTGGSDNTARGQIAFTPSDQTDLPLAMEGGSGMEVYDHYYKIAVERVLKPLFFASIGFSVPITRMFSGPVAWRGIIYTVLMTISKLACGIWLMSFASPLRSLQHIAQRLAAACKRNSKPLVPGSQCADTDSNTPDRVTPWTQEQEAVPLEPLTDTNARLVSPEVRNSTPKPEKALSLYPACIVGLGMVARGEIGFLIAALAESKGVFGRPPNDEPSELFLIVTWAISLCTVIGPICVGLLVNRVKQLEAGSRKSRGEGNRNVLGAWGKGQRPLPTASSLQLEQRIFWSCFRAESELHLGIGLPSSGLEELSYPDAFPAPPEMADARGGDESEPVGNGYDDGTSPGSDAQLGLLQQQRSWSYCLAEISLRRTIDDNARLVYAKGPGYWMRHPAQVVQQCRDSEMQISVWHHHLPPLIQFDQGQPPKNEFSDGLQMRFLEWREMVLRPVLYLVLHHHLQSQQPQQSHANQCCNQQTLPADALPLAAKAVEVCAATIVHNVSEQRHGSTCIKAGQEDSKPDQPEKTSMATIRIKITLT